MKHCLDLKGQAGRHREDGKAAAIGADARIVSPPPSSGSNDTDEKLGPILAPNSCAIASATDRPTVSRTPASRKLHRALVAAHHPPEGCRAGIGALAEVSSLAFTPGGRACDGVPKVLGDLRR